jgi:hypothetical protein
MNGNMRGVALLLVLVSANAPSAQPAPQIACATSAACAQMAADAITQSEFETAHDLAWRAVQLGPHNDAASMYLLARTQSLSGRPHDALVMLRRLAALGFRPDEVETLDDFRRVRALADWPDALAALRGTLASASARVESPASDGGTTSPKRPERREGRPVAPGLPIPSSVITPVALAYDAVSDRFVVADENSDTLKIVDERTGHVINLVSRGWSGAYRPTALAIDPRRGDLWAAGVETTDGVPRSALHKLQLVSGRLLQTVPLPTDAGAVRLVHLAVGSRAVFALDAAGRRVFALADGATEARVVANLVTITDPVSIALAGDNVLYVAHAKGLARVDLRARTRLPIAVPTTVDLTDLQSISWHEGSLFAIQRNASGAHAATRIRLDARGTTATSLETLGPAVTRAAGVYGGIFYYVASESDGVGMILRGTRAR